MIDFEWDIRYTVHKHSMIGGVMMLTPERHERILQTLSRSGTVKLKELVDVTGTSESTIRRDLIELENAMLLKRVHGGAEAINRKRLEPTMVEKSTKNADEKHRIGAYAATLVEAGDCIYVDAGSTTLAFIEALEAEDVIVVTNGIAHLQLAIQKGFETYIVGGRAKSATGAVIGRTALMSLEQYRLDKCFIGTNGIHPDAGLTTPDQEEAMIKEVAMKRSAKSYVLADQSKFAEVYFSHIASLNQATIITDKLREELKQTYEKMTTIWEVE